MYVINLRCNRKGIHESIVMLEKRSWLQNL